MRSFVMFALVGGLVFSIGLGVQMGAMQQQQVDSAAAEGESTDEAKSAPPAPFPTKSAPAQKRLRFPDDLAPATMSKPRAIPQAASFSPKDGPHKLAVLKPGGQKHDWQDYFPDDWRAYRVEDTELIVIVGAQKKIFVDKIHFQAGPPIDRYMFDLVVSVVEPRTGNVIGYRTFRNVPREIRNSEAWETTALGRPIGWNTVFRWVSTNARIGFPEEHDPRPVINEVDG
jgi:hypothetical protein